MNAPVNYTSAIPQFGSSVTGNCNGRVPVSDESGFTMPQVTITVNVTGNNTWTEFTFTLVQNATYNGTVLESGNNNTYLTSITAVTYLGTNGTFAGFPTTYAWLAGPSTSYACASILNYTSSTGTNDNETFSIVAVEAQAFTTGPFNGFAAGGTSIYIIPYASH